MKREIKFMIGPCGSGKSWAGNQVEDAYTYVRHDQYDAPDYLDAVIEAARTSEKPVLCEAPFRTQVIRDRLIDEGFDLQTYYIDEPAEVVPTRFEMRERRPWPMQHRHNHRRYSLRDYDHRGTSEQIRDLLKR